MLLYLVRHGDAKRSEEDPLRPLSNNGVKEVNKIAAYASGKGVRVNRIFHSGKLRAEQTAQILFRHLQPEKAISDADGLAPMDDPRIWFNRISGMEEDIMLVGHLPYMSVLSDLLLSGGKGRSQLGFNTGGTACLSRDSNGKWKLEWMVNPGDIE
jgi:phosphohistidine phosphatase